MRAPGSTARIIIALVVLAAIVLVVFAAGWADDRASPGSQGRTRVTAR